MKRLIFSAVFSGVLLALILTGCTSLSSDNYMEITGIDLSSQKAVSVYDSHGFHGDGVKCEVYDCKGTDIENIVTSSHLWKKLPLSRSIRILLYGDEAHDKSQGSYFTDDSGKALIPYIEEGYYTFYDRHSEAENPRDDTAVSGRWSYNFSLAVYDSNDEKLYFFELDT